MLSSDLQYALDPVAFAIACGIEPDPWQRDLLENHWPKTILNCCRQSGKSTTSALMALHTALYTPGSLCLLASPSQRQSGELFRTVMSFARRLDPPLPIEMESVLRVELKNGSRIVSLPGSESTVRGYSKANLIILDEASRIEDAMIAAIRPMQAVAIDARMLVLSTPFGRRGFFFDTWSNGSDWHKIKITAHDVDRISEAFLSDERRELGEWTYKQEYLGEFADSNEQLFAGALIEAAVSDEVRPLWV